MGVGFVSGAQIDAYGNLNIVAIGDYDNPKVRLVGPLAQTDHCAFAKRTFIPMEHTKRQFVEKVDFISRRRLLGRDRARAKRPACGKAAPGWSSPITACSASTRKPSA